MTTFHSLTVAKVESETRDAVTITGDAANLLI